MPAYTSSVALDDLTKLPRVAIVHMEHAPETFWRASGDIEVGAVVAPTLEAHGKTFYEVGGKVAEVSSSASIATFAGRLGIAMNETGIMTADDLASETVGPNEVMNEDIASGSWVRVLKKATFFTSLVAPVATATGFATQYAPGTLIGYNPAGTRGADFTGTGSFMKVTSKADAIGYVVESKKVKAEGANDEGYLSITLFD
jgi:hypothetical protein